jgi:uncharacterized membrane protein YadS
LFDSVPIDCRTYNQAFKSFLDKNPALKDAVFVGALGSTVGKVESGSVSVVTAAGDILSNSAKTAGNISKMLTWLVPVLILLIIIGLGFYVYKKSITTT